MGRKDGMFDQTATEWKTERTRKQEARSTLREEQLKQQCTFKPQISKMSKKMMRQIGQKGVIQNVQVLKPDKFENRTEFYQERKNHRLQAIHSEMMKNCSFHPQIFSKDAKGTLHTQPMKIR